METKIKKLAAGLGIICLALGAFAQTGIKGGIVGGVLTGPVEIDNMGNRFSSVINGNNINGFEAGLFIKPQIGFLYLKPEALYQFRVGNVSYTDFPGGAQQSTDFTLNKVEVPVLVGINLPGPFYVEAGPSYNYIFDVTSKYNESTVQFNKSGMGYRIGFGAELGRVMLSVNYGGTATTQSDNKATFKEPYKVIFGAGLIFGNEHRKKSRDKDRENDK
jgi:hypothetical protein